MTDVVISVKQSIVILITLLHTALDFSVGTGIVSALCIYSGIYIGSQGM